MTLLVYLLSYMYSGLYEVPYYICFCSIVYIMCSVEFGVFFDRGIEFQMVRWQMI